MIHIDIDSPTVRATIRRTLTGVGTAGLTDVLLDNLRELVGVLEVGDDAMVVEA